MKPNKLDTKENVHFYAGIFVVQISLVNSLGLLRFDKYLVNYWARSRLPKSWLWNLSCHFPKLDYPQWFIVHNLPFRKSIHLEEFNRLILLLNSLYSRKKLSRDLGSPGSPQLLHLQLSSRNFLNFGPPSWFSVVFKRLDPWIFGHVSILNDFED